MKVTCFDDFCRLSNTFIYGKKWRLLTTFISNVNVRNKYAVAFKTENTVEPISNSTKMMEETTTQKTR